MARTLINISLLLILLILVWVMTLKPDYSRPNIEYMPDMAHTPAYTSFSENPNFPDGKTLQPPVEGTIAQGEEVLHYGLGNDEAIRAGEELSNPFSPEDPDAITRGKKVFMTFCIPCHGTDATGNGPVVQKGFPRPPSLVNGNSKDYPDGRLFHNITYGVGLMPSYAAQVAYDDRWKVIIYLRTLQ